MSIPGGWTGWCTQKWHGAKEMASTAAGFAVNTTNTAVKLTKKVYRVAVDSVIPTVYNTTSTLCRLATGKIQQIATSTAGAVSTAAHIGSQILFNINAAVDEADTVQQLKIHQSVKARYHKVQPTIVQQFYDRFGCETMLEIEKFTHEIQDHISGPTAVALKVIAGQEAVRVDLQTIALGTVSWAADKLKHALPDNNATARSEFASAVARDIEAVTETFEKVTNQTRAKGLDWLDADFAQHYDSALANTPLAKRVGHQKEFYTNLAERLLTRLERELPEQIEPHLRLVLEAASEGLDAMFPDKKREFVASLLMQLHETITDPSQIKEWLIKVMDSSSESLETKYDTFLNEVDSASWWIPFHNFITMPAPHATEQPESPDYDPAYGKPLMNILQTLQPKVMGVNALKLYASLAKGDIKEGSDFLTVLLRDSTGSSIEGMMTPNTDIWIKEAIKIAKLKLLNAEEHFMQRPGHVSEAEWKELSPEQRLNVCNKSTSLYKSFKNRQIERIDKELLASSKRLSKGVFKAGFVVEQFLAQPLQVANNTSKNWLIRALAGLGAFLRQLPIIHFILNCIHRLSISIRTIIAEKASKPTAESIKERLDQFLKTNSIDVMAMHLLERTLTRLELLDDPRPSDFETMQASQKPVIEAQLSQKSRLEESLPPGAST